VGAAEEEAAAAALVEAENVLVEGRGREGGGGAGLPHLFAALLVARRTSETPHQTTTIPTSILLSI